MGDFLSRTPMNHRAKFDAASFVLAGEIRNRTNKQKTQTVTDIFTPCLSAFVDKNEASKIKWSTNFDDRPHRRGRIFHAESVNVKPAPTEKHSRLQQSR